MAQREPTRFEARLDAALRAVETALLVTLLAAMVGVATYQIVARNLSYTGLAWGSDLVHVGMLWATMIGAVAAARGNSHISIDLVARFGGPRLQQVAARITALFAAVLCGALGWYAIDVIKVDYEYGTPGVAAVPAWVCESIIPIAAAIMAVTYLLRTIWPPVDAASDVASVAAPSAPDAKQTRDAEQTPDAEYALDATPPPNGNEPVAETSTSPVQETQPPSPERQP